MLQKQKDIFPDDIGELQDFSQQNFIIGDNGDMIPVANFFTKGILIIIVGGIKQTFNRQIRMNWERRQEL